MGTPARGALRWARAASLAVATVGLAAAAHVLAGGDVPGPAALAVLALLTSLVCILLTGRRRGLPAIVLAMSGLQVVLHQGFMLLGRPAAGGPGCSLSGHAEHTAGALPALCAGAHAHAHHAAASPTMLLAHAVAVLLLSAALAGGEHALWVLRRLVRRPLRPAPLPAVPALASAFHHALALTVVVPGVWTSVRDLVRRGPPVHATVVPV